MSLSIPLPRNILRYILQLNPRRTFQLAHLPIRAIRFITDPVVDMVALVIQITLFGPFLRTCQRLLDAGFFRPILDEGRVKGIGEVLTSTVSLFSMTAETVF